LNRNLKKTVAPRTLFPRLDLPGFWPGTETFGHCGLDLV